MKKIFYLVLAFSGLLLCSCTDMDDNIVAASDTESIIEQNSPLINLIERAVDVETDSVAITCVDFSYPFTTIVYNASLQPIGSHTIYDDAFFIDFLDNLSPGLSLSISYPINMINADGETIAINNNDELKASLLSCEQEEYISWAGNSFCTPGSTCVWLVSATNWAGVNAKYAGGYFSANTDGTITFYYEGESYVGTWVFLFAGTDFQLNINLEGTSDVAAYWNHSYPATVGDYMISLRQDEYHTCLLTRQCEETQTYAIGQQGPAGGTVFYDKGSYSDGWRYMEAATTDIDTLAQWGCDAVSIAGAQSPAIGHGLTNSGKIKAFFDALPDYYNTATTCSTTADGTVAANSTLWINNDFQQWFLPSKEELLLIYQNLTANGQGTMLPQLYWTATEVDASTATAIDFATGQPADIPKAQAAVKIRAVRYF